MTTNIKQTERIQGYFIQAAKEILKGEGIRGISARNVARQAGYSYATLYNYFKDINDLVFVCVQDFAAECRQFVEDETDGIAPGRPKIESIGKSYIKFFIQYPGIFELFFLERIGNFGHQQKNIERIHSLLDELCAESWEACRDDFADAESIERRKEQLRFSIVGQLLLYLNRHQPAGYHDFLDQADRLIATILQ